MLKNRRIPAELYRWRTTLYRGEDMEALSISNHSQCHVQGPHEERSMLTDQELEAGVLLILASVVGLSFGKMWRPGIYIPHSGSLPHEEYLREKSLPTEADGTFILNGRPWLILK